MATVGRELTQAAEYARWLSEWRNDFYGPGYFGSGRDPSGERLGWSGYASYERVSSNADVSGYVLWRNFGQAVRVLDVGCATGYLVEVLRELGLDAEGCDMSQYAARHPAPGARGHITVTDILAGLPYPDAQFDVVTALETLEHLPPTRIPSALSELRRICAGFLWATIPSFGPNGGGGPDGHLEGKVRPERTRFFESLGPAYEGPVRYEDLARDNQGEPVEGHLTIASYSWWERQFARVGFQRRPDLERRMYSDIEPSGLRSHWDIYVFSVPGAREELASPRSPRSTLVDLGLNHPLFVPDGPALAGLQQVWDAQASADPLWAVLSEPERAGRQWDVASFMATGKAQVEKEVARFHELGGVLPDRELAVDFGSGVGRLTQPLGDQFERVIGIDISPTMIAIANRLNAQGERVSYVLNDLPEFPFLETASVSFVFSAITLQHAPPPAILSYLEEFFRIAKPGAGMVFQLPSHFSDNYLPMDRTDTPVPAAARRGSVCIPAVPHTMTAGHVTSLDVMVTNRSDERWTQSKHHPLNVGNHWFDERNGSWALDDGRSRLPGRLGSGEEVLVPLEVRAPSRPGTYTLQVDLVQEGVCWFADHGNPPFEMRIEVRPARSAGPRAPSSRSTGYRDSTFDDLISRTFSPAPMFEMNAIPRPQVEAIIRRHGAALLGADEWVNEWHSFTYYIQVTLPSSASSPAAR
jgi:SAM-dependent methyltransferase